MLSVLAFPAGCQRYWGSFSLDCLHSLWINTKCLEEGYRNPAKLSGYQLSVTDNMNLRYEVLKLNKIPKILMCIFNLSLIVSAFTLKILLLCLIISLLHREAQIFLDDIKKKAESGNDQAQRDCFGLSKFFCL